MYLQIVILLVLILTVIVAVAWFFSAKKSIVHAHEEATAMLESAIYNHRSQINFRILHLNRYDFLKYNLDEALVVQSAIEL